MAVRRVRETSFSAVVSVTLTHAIGRHLRRAVQGFTATVVGLRDRALISVMTFAFARIGAVVAMRVEDYYPKGKRWWVRLHEKGGKRHEMPAHHTLEAYLDSYIETAGLRDAGKAPLFRSVTGRPHRHTDRKTDEPGRCLAHDPAQRGLA
jgi:site-specific recombinase XerC